MVIKNIKECYRVDEMYHLQVEPSAKVGNNLKEDEIWEWTIYISKDGFDYYGMAMANRKEKKISWRKLDQHEYLDEIKELCREKTEWH
ncbi:hypothetical protein [Bacillus mycoides]|uniref:hypothetical protein n=1 Tax=Bacillus mycoides TaxID=1405 RepID=UPI001FB325A7|nr:hypothetical protein [Bacillus mycoides]UNP84810.1 hypothetical protein MN034_30015 [Bacillus mycoides]